MTIPDVVEGQIIRFRDHNLNLSTTKVTLHAKNDITLSVENLGVEDAVSVLLQTNNLSYTYMYTSNAYKSVAGGIIRLL